MSVSPFQEGGKLTVTLLLEVFTMSSSEFLDTSSARSCYRKIWNLNGELLRGICELPHSKLLVGVTLSKGIIQRSLGSWRCSSRNLLIRNVLARILLFNLPILLVGRIVGQTQSFFLKANQPSTQCVPGRWFLHGITNIWLSSTVLSSQEVSWWVLLRVSCTRIVKIAAKIARSANSFGRKVSRLIIKISAAMGTGKVFLLRASPDLHRFCFGRMVASARNQVSCWAISVHCPDKWAIAFPTSEV